MSAEQESRKGAYRRYPGKRADPSCMQYRAAPSASRSRAAKAGRLTDVVFSRREIKRALEACAGLAAAEVFGASTRGRLRGESGGERFGAWPVWSRCGGMMGSVSDGEEPTGGSSYHHIISPLPRLRPDNGTITTRTALACAAPAHKEHENRTRRRWKRWSGSGGQWVRAQRRTRIHSRSPVCLKGGRSRPRRDHP